MESVDRFFKIADTHYTSKSLTLRCQLLARLFVLSSFLAMWLNNDCTFATATWSALICLCILIVIDTKQDSRFLPSSVMAQIMFGISLFMFVCFYCLGNKAAGRTYFTFADCFVVSFWITIIFSVHYTFWAWLLHSPARNGA